MAGVELGTWYSKVRFQAEKCLGGAGGAESCDPRQGSEPQEGREGKGGSGSPAWSQAAIQPSPRELIMARIASGEGAGSCLGSLSISDCDLLGGPRWRREGEGAQVCLGRSQRFKLRSQTPTVPPSLTP